MSISTKMLPVKFCNRTFKNSITWGEEINFVLADKNLYEKLKTSHSKDFESFLTIFPKLQHFPDFPFVNEGIESYIVDIPAQTLTKDLKLDSNGFLGQGTLDELPSKNQFLKSWILGICDQLSFFSNKLHVVIKLHQRQIQAGNEKELRGLGPLSMEFSSNHPRKMGALLYGAANKYSHSLYRKNWGWVHWLWQLIE